MTWPGASLFLFPGLTLQPPCPRGSADCRKQCNHDYYLDRDGRCKACVTCSGGKGHVSPPGASSREQGWSWKERPRIWGCWEAVSNHMWPDKPVRQAREPSVGVPSRRGLTPRGSLECNPEIPVTPGVEHYRGEALFRCARPSGVPRGPATSTVSRGSKGLRSPLESRHGSLGAH